MQTEIVVYFKYYRIYINIIRFIIFNIKFPVCFCMPFASTFCPLYFISRRDKRMCFMCVSSIRIKFKILLLFLVVYQYCLSTISFH